MYRQMSRGNFFPSSSPGALTFYIYHTANPVFRGARNENPYPFFTDHGAWSLELGAWSGAPASLMVQLCCGLILFYLERETRSQDLQRPCWLNSAAGPFYFIWNEKRGLWHEKRDPWRQLHQQCCRSMSSSSSIPRDEVRETRSKARESRFTARSSRCLSLRGLTRIKHLPPAF